MGAFYSNLTLRTKDRDAVITHLSTHGRAGYVSRAENDAVVVFDEQADLDTEELANLAAELSDTFKCAALAVVNHDDDVLLYMLLSNGDLIDEYVSAPDYFESEATPMERGGDADALAKTFGVSAKRNAIDTLLTSSSGDTVADETDRHAQLVALLNLPASAVSTGFSELEEEMWPMGYDAEAFTRV